MMELMTTEKCDKCLKDTYDYYNVGTFIFCDDCFDELESKIIKWIGKEAL